MIPARLDFPCRTNADYTEEFSVITDGGEPVDLTGCSAVLTARLSVNHSVLFTLPTVVSDVEGLYFIEAADGIVSVRIDRETLANAYSTAATHAEYGSTIDIVYDMKFTMPNGDQEVWFEGVIPIKKGVGA